MSTSLQQEVNYLTSLQATEHDCTMQYFKLIQEYTCEYDSKILFQNTEKQKYIYEKGIETIEHIFMFVLLYSNNLELTVENTQRGICYYIEFISQMGEESSQILNICYLDAIIFTYRKTIFDIPNNIKKDFKNASHTLSFIKQYTAIYNQLIKTHIKNETTTPSNIDFLIPTQEALLGLPLLCPQLESIKIIITELSSKVPIIKYMQFINLFIKHLYRNEIKMDEIEKKLITIKTDDLTNITQGKLLKLIVN